MTLPQPQPPLFILYAVIALLLGLKALLLGAATAARRGRLKQFLNEEDAVWLGGAYANPDPEPVARLGRAHRNDLENLLLFALSGGLYLLTGASFFIGAVCYLIFFLARLAHTLAYLTRRPRLRRNAYIAGFVVIAVMSLYGIACLVWLAVTGGG